MEFVSDKAFLQSKLHRKLSLLMYTHKNIENLRAFHFKKSSLKIIVSYLQIHYNMIDNLKYSGDILILLKAKVDTVDLISIGNHLYLCGEERRGAA